MTIWKYTLDIDDAQTIEMPHHARLLTVQMQGNAFCLWALVCPLNSKVQRRIHIVGTGNPAPEGIDKMDYIGTVQMAGGRLVWHVFAEPEAL